jgi:hypothetical protein
VLRLAVAQPRDRAPQRAVHLQLEELITVDPDAPRGVDVRDDTALEFEGRVGGVLRSRLVGLAGLVPTFRDVRSPEAGDGPHLSEEVVEDVAPMGEHVHDNPAALFFTVVPGWPLCGTPVALEHPVAELAAHREDAAEEAAVYEALELDEAGQK